jgi:TM2 domain-containing membrane protein YozV
MLPLKTKRHPLRFYGMLIFYTVFVIFICFVIWYTENDKKKNSEQYNGNDFIPFAIGLFILTIIYLLFVYYRNCPILLLEEKGISFNKKYYSWEQVTQLQLSGKQAFPMLLYFPMECITLQFHDDKSLFIFDELYKNSQEIKDVLQHKIHGEKLPMIENVSPTEMSEADNDFFETYKGNQLTNFRGIMIWFFVGLGLYNFINDKFFNNMAIVTYCFLSLFIFFLLSWTMHYFMVGQKYLIVKNHNLLWIKKVYRLDNIEEVIFETQGKLPHCMRIITKDFKRSRLFPAGTLRDKTWMAMKAELENKGIKVRNECV